MIWGVLYLSEVHSQITLNGSDRPWVRSAKLMHRIEGQISIGHSQIYIRVDIMTPEVVVRLQSNTVGKDQLATSPSTSTSTCT